MKTTFILIAILILSAECFACRSDYDCDYGNKCVSTVGGYSEGVCIAPQERQQKFDTSMYQKSNMINYADEVRKGQTLANPYQNGR